MKVKNFIEEYGLNEPLFVFIALFVLILTVYSQGKPELNDSRWAVPAAYSLITRHTYDVSEFQSLVLKDKGQYVRDVNGKLYPGAPVGVSIMAAPFVAAVSTVVNFQSLVQKGFPLDLDHFIAAVYTALAAGFIFLIGRLCFKKTLPAILLALVFAFCTSAWSTASLNLWQHGPSMMLLGLALYLLLKAEKNPSFAAYASLPLAFSYIVRPTDIIPCVLLSVYVFFRFRKFFLRYLAGIVFITILFFLFNYLSYRAPFSPYYEAGALSLSPDEFLAGLAGQLVSPARGLFIFSPVLLLSFYGIYLKVRNKAFASLDYFLVAIIFLHWIVISAFQPWWAGHSYGPRYFTDMLPYLFYFMIPAAQKLLSLKSLKLIVVTAGVTALLGVSFFANYQGIYNGPSRDWNVHPQIFSNQWRLWDWTDIPYLRSDYFK